MGRSREDRVYRVRQLPLHLEDRGDVAAFLAKIVPILGTIDNIRVFSLACGKRGSKNATLMFRATPAIFDNNEEQWTLDVEDICGHNVIIDIHFRDFTALNEPKDSHCTAERKSCIAISGLASHPFGSWKHRASSSNFMWLRDRLPQDVPQIRSLIYGYDTKLFKSHSFQDLDDIARSFIASLKEIRRSSSPANSLIFLAHSLGGIMLKRALVLLAQEPNNEEVRILQDVKGVVFFGVPHRGMEISHLLAMVAKQPNEDLISSCLSPDSTLLPELDEDFAKVTLGISQNITFVYETLESPLTEQTPTGAWVRSKDSYAVLVNKDSSVPSGSLLRDTIPVNDDHSNMVKFSEDDSVCQTIITFLKDLSKDRDTQNSGHNRSNYSQALQASPLGTQNPKEGFTAESISFAATQNRLTALSNIPFSRDPSFVGRKHILAQLESKFADPKSQSWVSLHGLGGIGKSQIAIEYSYIQKERFPHKSIFWVHASSKARFEQSFAQIAMVAKIPGNEDGRVDILQALSTWLKNQDHGPWLLILDNADDASVLLDMGRVDNGTEASPARHRLLDLLPRVKHGEVLITTRDRSCALILTGYRGTPVEVVTMSSGESVELLRIPLPEARQEEASELVQELKYVPLAISQAGAYIKEVPRVSIPRYLSIFRRSDKDQVALLNKNKEDMRRDPGVPNAVITSWELSFTQIRNASPSSADIMSLMAYLNRQAIPKSLIQGDLDEISFENDINVLLNFSLVRAEIREDTFEMHRLVQTATQHWLCSEDDDQFWKKRAIQRVAQQFPAGGDQAQHWPVCETLTSHADETIHYTTDSQDSELNRAHILQCTAWYLVERKAQHVLSEQRSEDALRIQRRYLDNDSYVILGTLETLAVAQIRLHKFEEARDLVEFILKQRLESWGTEHEASVTAMHNLAFLHMESGQYDKAEYLLKRVIHLQKRLFDPKDRALLASEGLLADIHVKQGKFEEAEKLASRLMDVYSRNHGFEHVGTLNAIDFLSRAYLRQYKLNEAERLIAESIPILTKTFGPCHYRTLDARTRLSAFFYKQNKLDEAKKVCLSALDIAQEVLGRQNNTTLCLMNMLGLICQERGDVTDAFVVKELADSSAQIWGSDHPQTLTGKHNFAICHELRARLRKIKAKMRASPRNDLSRPDHH